MPGHLNNLVLACLCAAASIAASTGGPPDAKYFRSDEGLTGLPAGPLPARFDEPTGPVWRVPVDSGHSTPILCGDKIFLTTYRAGSKELAAEALDRQTGQSLWRQPISAAHIEQTHPIGSPATATPACDGRRVFVFFGSYGLICYGLGGQKNLGTSPRPVPGRIRRRQFACVDRRQNHSLSGPRHRQLSGGVRLLDRQDGVENGAA